MGFGIIGIDGKKISLHEMGVLKLSKYKDHGQRLHYIFEKVSALVQIHQPQAVALEAPFFGKNVQSMLKLGRAQGVAIAAAMAHGSTIFEYAPRKIKQAITGNGNAYKEQVVAMLERLLTFTHDSRFLDSTDAVAAALCHHYECSGPLAKLPPSTNSTNAKTRTKKADAWAEFVNQNEGRIIK